MAAFSGGCHCGAIRYACSAEPLAAGHCQCSDCRRLSASGHTSSLAVPLAALHVTGRPTGYTHGTESGNTLTRSFCATCGAPLFSVSSASPDVVNLRASSLDDPTVFKPQGVGWVGSAPAWDFMDPALPRYPGNRPAPRR
jgi:hypothetical protein